MEVIMVARRAVLLFALTAIILALSSCSRRDALVGPTGADRPDVLTGGGEGPVFLVSPSGGDDTYAIQEAFDNAVTAGPGAVVELTEGQFYCNNIVVEGFVGTFRGQGKGLTRIDALRGLDPDAPPIEKMVFMPDVEWSALLVFRSCDVRISDMTFDITPYMPGETYYYHFVPWEGLGSIVMIMGRYSSSDISGVVFRGNAGLVWSRYNVAVSLMVSDGFGQLPGTRAFFAPTTGTYVIGRCDFDNSLQPIALMGLVDASVKVGGNAGARNTLSDHIYGIVTNDFSNSRMEVSYNEFNCPDSWISVALQQCTNPHYPGEPFSWLDSPSEFLVAHNEIHGGTDADGIALNDLVYRYTGRKTLTATITTNRIDLTNSYWRAVYGYAADAVITNNVISGEMFAAVCAYPWVAENWTLVGNNVQNATCPFAQIILGSLSSDFTVVGGSNETNVLDLGVNNKLVGVTKVKGKELGQEVKDAMEQREEMLRW
jgi:hypothetical protein